MTPLKKFTGIIFLINLTFLTIPSCSTVPILNVHYRAPDKTNQLAGKKVFLEIRDSRQDKEMLSDSAKESFQNAPDNVSLSIAEGDEKGFKIGLFTAAGLMKEIFKERLELLGLDVVTDINSKGEEPSIVIDLQTFKLDLIKGTVKRTWSGKMSYNVEISDNGKVLLSRKISGENEKLKVIFREEADSLMSELVTDLVNRLNVEDLFRTAGLI